jgi:hypothetical protein
MARIEHGIDDHDVTRRTERESGDPVPDDGAGYLTFR